MTGRGGSSQRQRRSIRLKEYDYGSAGAYFVTICTRRRECILDDPVITGIITDVWHALPEWFPTIALDEFVVMPNHVHFIVWLQDGRATARGAGASPAPTVGATLAVAPDKEKDWIIPRPQQVNQDPRLSDVVRTFKSLVFKIYLDWIRVHDPERRAKFWQRNYYEHVIRNERALQAVRCYIQDNPAQWELDRDHPLNFNQSQPQAGYLVKIGQTEQK